MQRSMSAATCAAVYPICLLAAAVHAVEPPHDDQGHPDVMVVTASPVEKTQDELADAIDVVDRDLIQSHGGTTVGEVLQFEPGINTSGFAPGASRPVIRGLDSFRVRGLQDGLGTHGCPDATSGSGSRGHSDVRG